MKSLVSPLMWYLIAALLSLLMIRRSTVGSSRHTVNGLLLLTLVLTVVSTSLMEGLLQRSLGVDRTIVSGGKPGYIFVLGGGYRRGSTPSGDVLVTESAARVRQAVTEWRSNASSLLVFSGGATSDGRGRSRQGQLMASAAASYGVPDSLMVIEPRSRNTREHPIEALRIPGVTSLTHVAIVTSGQHMRRARREFCRYFELTDFYPVPSSVGVVSMRGLVPQAALLAANTSMLREWVGIVWYAIRGLGVEDVGDC